MLNGLLLEGTAGSIIPDLRKKQAKILDTIKKSEFRSSPWCMRETLLRGQYQSVIEGDVLCDEVQTDCYCMQSDVDEMR